MEFENRPVVDDGTWAACRQQMSKVSSSYVKTDSWPKALDAELAWESSTFVSRTDHTLALTEAEILEVQSALQYFNGL
jgi:hypothetical protein